MQLAAARRRRNMYIFTVFLMEKNVNNCIRMGITVFIIFNWGGISSDIRSEIMFHLISDRISYYIPPQMKILKTVVP